MASRQAGLALFVSGENVWINRPVIWLVVLHCDLWNRLERRLRANGGLSFVVRFSQPNVLFNRTFIHRSEGQHFQATIILTAIKKKKKKKNRSLHCLAQQHALPSASAVACGTSCFQRKACNAIAVHSMVPDLQLSRGLTHRASAALAGCSSRKSSATQSRQPVGVMSFRSKCRK